MTYKSSPYLVSGSVGGELEVCKEPDYSQHPLVIGPMYEEEDLDLTPLGYLKSIASGTIEGSLPPLLLHVFGEAKSFRNLGPSPFQYGCRKWIRDGVLAPKHEHLNSTSRTNQQKVRERIWRDVNHERNTAVLRANLIVRAYLAYSRYSSKLIVWAYLAYSHNSPKLIFRA